MIPEEVENRIAKYFLWTYLSDEVMNKIEDKLLPPCTWLEQEDLDHDELVIGINKTISMAHSVRNTQFRGVSSKIAI